MVFVFQGKEESFWDKLTCMINNKSDFKVWEKEICDEAEEESYTKISSLMAEQSWMGSFCLKNVAKQVTDVKS